MWKARTGRLMAGFAIHDLALGPGRIGLCPMPGRDGAYGDDLATVLSWRPGLVVTMVTGAELARGAATFPADLAAAGITWRHLPVADFAAQSAELGLLQPQMQIELDITPLIR